MTDAKVTIERKTHHDLRRLGEALDREAPKGLGEKLLCFADDWRVEVESLAQCQQCQRDAETDKKIRVLRKALADAIECVQDWGLYASPYFIEKHDLNGDVKRLRAALEASNDSAA